MPIGIYPRPSTESLFWKKVNKLGPVHPVLKTRCWVWLAGTSGSGSYGHMTIKRKGWFSHRYSWTIHNGEIAEGLYVLHHCDNVLCVNPAHLFLGTHLDNAKDRNAKGRHSKGEDRPAHKLTEQDVLEIRKHYKRWSYHGSNVQQLAAKYQVHPDTIRVVARAKSWKHIPNPS